MDDGARGPARRAPVVGIVGGSRSDFPILEKARALLDELGVPCELRVVSAHRTPDHLFRYAETAAGRGIRVIVAGAGGAAHLPGMLAAKTQLPVIGVPIPTQHLGGLDSLLSIVQMPRGIPVATVAIGSAENAALLAAAILALSDAGARGSAGGVPGRPDGERPWRREQRRAARVTANLGLPPRSVPEPRPTPLQKHYVLLSAPALVLGTVAITALEIGAAPGSPLDQAVCRDRGTASCDRERRRDRPDLAFGLGLDAR